MVEKLQKDLIQAMKNHEKEKVTVLRMVSAAMKQQRIDNNREENDDLLLDVINKEIKMRKDSISQFEKGNRQDLVDKTQAEIEILMNYLPEQLSKQEVLKIINEIFEKVKPESQKDMGKVMQEAKSVLKGKADMKDVSSIIREKLQ